MERPKNPLNLSPEEFTKLGYQVVDLLADHYRSLEQRDNFPSDPIWPGKIKLDQEIFPEIGSSPEQLIEEVLPFILENTAFTGHPRFFAYITGSASPLASLIDLFASAVNVNVASWNTAGCASAFETQAISWLAQMIGYGPSPDGILLSGGTMANILALQTARHTFQKTHQVPISDMRIYLSSEVHPWILKAADLMAFQKENFRYVATDENGRMLVSSLRQLIEEDLESGLSPLCVIATCGTVSFGFLDPVMQISELCRERNIWLHLDGAYGAITSIVPGSGVSGSMLSLADSIALDPHKWLYLPLEIGCLLVKKPGLLEEAFSTIQKGQFFASAPSSSQSIPTPYREKGLQTSRYFRGLKLWSALKVAGKEGYASSVGYDISLASTLFELVQKTEKLEAHSQNLSIVTFRYHPSPRSRSHNFSEQYLNELNKKILIDLQSGGEIFPSHAISHGKYLIRVCIVNFRTQSKDIELIPELVTKVGDRILSSYPPT